MITQLHIERFKSWKDTGQIRLAPITGLFGTNSSGKTAILQLLLMLKQTTESTDRQRVLHSGDERAYVDLGTFYDIIYQHQLPGTISFALGWQLPEILQITDPESQRTLFSLDSLTFKAALEGTSERIAVKEFLYSFHSGNTEYQFGMEEKPGTSNESRPEYRLIAHGYNLKRNRGRGWDLPAPVKSYGFPDQVNAYYQNAGFLSDLVLAFEQLFQGIYYLGPLREYPRRSYTWAGDKPQDVGRRGELAVHALLASRSQERLKRGPRKRRTVEERIAECLQELGLIDTFALRRIAEHRNDYEVRVRRSKNAPEVLITDVGFGISQVLPVLVLCYYVPEGSTIILEQPEIHLHPSVQAGLADIFIDAIKTRNIQIIVESHSEHLLRRLQRRIAEEQLSSEQAALYFCELDEQGTSQLNALALDVFGNITNWPPHFFGDDLGDMIAMTEAMERRQQDLKG